MDTVKQLREMKTIDELAGCHTFNNRQRIENLHLVSETQTYEIRRK